MVWLTEGPFTGYGYLYNPNNPSFAPQLNGMKVEQYLIEIALLLKKILSLIRFSHPIHPINPNDSNSMVVHGELVVLLTVESLALQVLN